MIYDFTGVLILKTIAVFIFTALKTGSRQNAPTECESLHFRNL